MSKSDHVWVIDDDRSIRWVLEKALQRAAMRVSAFADGLAAIDALDSETPDAVVADIRMPGMSGLELLERLHRHNPGLPVIIMTAHSDLESALAAYQVGAFEYLPKPFDVDEAVALVRRACDVALAARPADEPTSTVQEIVGEAPAMQEVFRAIGRLSRSEITVLIIGESGTGKELVARALHRHSPRADGPFVAINTAAIPKDLLESELFGHERGAFTGAQSARMGRFEQADGGTLFLDEIGDMPADLQTRLLRVLAEGEFYRIGARTAKRVNVRVIAATHQDLAQRVDDKRFREDLYHRLNVMQIALPRLRQRPEDIPLLLDYYLQTVAAELDVEVKRLRPETLKLLCRFDWPGNVRQLENLCRRLTVMASGREIYPQDLPQEIHSGAQSARVDPAWHQGLRMWAKQTLAATVNCDDPTILKSALPDFEKILIDVALEHTGGHRQQAARLLGWGRNTLTRKIKEHYGAESARSR